MEKELKDKIVKNLSQQKDYLTTKSKQWIDEAKVVQANLAPYNGFFEELEKAPRVGYEDKKNFFSKSAKYADNLTSFFHYGVISPTKRWFMLTLEGNDSHEWNEQKKYLQELENIFYSIFNKSNFYTETNLAISEFIKFGTSVMGITEDRRNGRNGLPHFTVLTAGEWLIDFNSYNEVDTVFRRISMKNQDILDSWGETLEYEMHKNLSNKPFESTVIWHVVRPRKKIVAGKIGKSNKKFESIWISFDLNHIFEVSGFSKFPYFVLRWYVSPIDSLGRGPANFALKDITHSNVLQHSIIGKVENELNPPLVVSDSLSNGNFSTEPGAINFVHMDLANRIDDVIKPLFQVASNFNVAYEQQQYLDSVLKSHFMNDLMQIMNEPTTNMTAREIIERSGEKLQLLGSAIFSITKTFINPIFEWVFDMLVAKRLLPEIPTSLENENVVPEMIGIISQAQKMQPTQNIDQFFMFLLSVANADPNALKKVDIQQAIDMYASMMQLPFGIIRNDEDTQNLIDQEQQQLQQQQAEMNVTQNLQNMKTASEVMNSPLEVNKNELSIV